MTNEEPTGPIEVAIATCSSCDNLFLMSGRRETSPCCGADPGVILAMLVITPDGKVSGRWGTGAPIGERDITEQPAEPGEKEPPEEEEEEEEGEDTLVAKGVDALAIMAGDYLASGKWPHLELVGAFLSAGADPEAATTAVGRLEAVRDLLCTLQETREPALVASAPPEAENPPENTPPGPLTNGAPGV